MCARHGPVAPLHPVTAPRRELLAELARRSTVPMWLPWPLPTGWLVTGVAWAGDDRTGPRAVATACSGPAPLGGPGDLLVVSEELGVGLGAHLAGIAGPDPGSLTETPTAAVHTAGHLTPLWSVPGRDDRAAFVGEAHALWLWLILWPAPAGHLLAENVSMTDLRQPGHDLDLPFGALPDRIRRAVAS